MSDKPLVLLLPGWLDSGPLHWQSRWEALHGYTRVQQHDWQRPLRGDWQARLEEVVVNHIAQCVSHHQVDNKTLSNSQLLPRHSVGLQPDSSIENSPAVPPQAQRSIVLVAHSLGNHLVAAWASASRYSSAIRGALMVAPPDVTQSDLPPDLHNWRTPILQPLPFPATCVVSSNDPFCSPAAGQAMAAAWGARRVDAGPVGHLNSDSGLGDWPAGLALLQELMKD